MNQQTNQQEKERIKNLESRKVYHINKIQELKKRMAEFGEKDFDKISARESGIYRDLKKEKGHWEYSLSKLEEELK